MVRTSTAFISPTDLTLGLDIFLAVLTAATEVGNTRPSQSLPEKVARIHEVRFYCLTSSSWDDFSSSQDSLVNADNMDPMSSRDAYLQTLNSNGVFEHPCMPLTKILSSGSFYYSLDPPWDLSTRFAVRLSRDGHDQHDIGIFDERFVWNEYIVRSLLDFREQLDPHERQDLDRCQFIVRNTTRCLLVYSMSEPFLGSYHTGLRRCGYYGPSSTARQRYSCDCHIVPDFAPRVEESRDPLQYSRR